MQTKPDHLAARDDGLSTEQPSGNVLPFVTRAELEQRAMRAAGKRPAAPRREADHDDDPGPPAA